MSDVQKMDIPAILEESKSIDSKLIAQEILKWLYNNVENYVDNQTKIYKIDLVVDSDEMPMTKKLQDLYRAIPDEDLSEAVMHAYDEAVKGNITEDVNKKAEEASECRRELDKIVAESFEEIKKEEFALKNLFKRLIFFYEKIIMNPENKKRALMIDEELKSLIEGKENASDKEKAEIQAKITKLLEEGEKLVKWEEFEGVVSVTKFDYEAFSVGVKLSARPTEEAFSNKEVEKEVVKEYTIPEGFVVWMEINYRLKQRPTALF